jgi:hypothetical protein
MLLVSRFVDAYDDARAKALAPDDSAELIDRLARVR